MKNKSYIGISFIVLLFGIIFVPRIVNRIKGGDVVKEDRLNAGEDASSNEKLSYLMIGGEARKVPDFLLTNQDSLMVANEDYLGKVYVAEFFFTTCPTICPVMNKNMKTLDEAYGDRDDFGIASFTIDPLKDTPTRLKEYAELYEIKSQNWNFLTGPIDDIHGLANTGFNIFAGINPEVAGGFEHQGYFALIDKKGFIRSRADISGNPMVYYQGTDEEQVNMLKEDIKKLLEE